MHLIAQETSRHEPGNSHYQAVNTTQADEVAMAGLQSRPVESRQNGRSLPGPLAAPDHAVSKEGATEFEGKKTRLKSQTVFLTK